METHSQRWLGYSREGKKTVNGVRSHGVWQHVKGTLKTLCAAGCCLFKTY